MHCRLDALKKQICVSWSDGSLSFDAGGTPEAPILTVDIVKKCLLFVGRVVHIRWCHVPSVSALHLIYDTLATISDIRVMPPKSEALDAYNHISSPPDPPPAPVDIGVVAVPSKIHHSADPSRVFRVQSLDELLILEPDAVTINHVWAIRKTLGFPADNYDRKHSHIANNLMRWVMKIEPTPITCQLYAVGDGPPTPLLVWLRSYEDQVLGMLQEYLHLCHPEEGNARVWHWLLIPSDTPPLLCSMKFAAADIFPTWNNLFRVIVPDKDAPSFACLESAANRVVYDPIRCLMQTLYSNGSAVMWFGDQAFFYVQTEPVAGTKSEHQLPLVRVPEHVDELPPWVSQLMKEIARVDNPDSIDHNIDLYLDHFHSLQSTNRGLAFVRRINWALLPIHWSPVFMQHMRVRVSVNDSIKAQKHLVDSMGPNESQETKDEALSIIQSFTATKKRTHLQQSSSV